MWAWADRHLCTIGPDLNGDNREVRCVDMATPNASKSFTLLYETHPTGHAFSTSAPSSLAAVLSDEIMCWLGTVPATANPYFQASKSHLVCYNATSDSAVTSPEPNVASLQAVFSPTERQVYFVAGSVRAIWAMDLTDGSLTKMEDTVTQNSGFSASGLSFLSAERGVLFRYSE